MTAHTVKEAQHALNMAMKLTPTTVPPAIAEDGVVGKEETAPMIVKFQLAQEPPLPATGAFDERTLDALFPNSPTTAPKTIQATIEDYVINFIQSKIVWAAGVLVALAVTWINTRFGFNVPTDIQNEVTGLLVGGFGALIMWLRTFADAPHVTNVQPAVVKQPSITK